MESTSAESRRSVRPAPARPAASSASSARARTNRFVSSTAAIITTSGRSSTHRRHRRREREQPEAPRARVAEVSAAPTRSAARVRLAAPSAAVARGGAQRMAADSVQGRRHSGRPSPHREDDSGAGIYASRRLASRLIVDSSTPSAREMTNALAADTASSAMPTSALRSSRYPTPNKAE